jgi:hypothetical protein
MTRWLGVVMLGLLAAAALAQQVTIGGAEMAGISGFRAYWDKPVVVTEDGATRMSDRGQFGRGLVADWSTGKPGAPVFDAIHRGLLVRFPGAAEQIATELGKGNTVQKVEIVLPYVDAEFFPMDYSDPDGMSFLGDLWAKNLPTWHAVAFVVRKPWKADPQLGPTFNASVNGVSYWSRFGAQDVKADRFPVQFGPTEVSYKQPVGRMDVTALLADPAYGKTLADRLRVLSDQGFLLKKWETYDARFNHGGYEYGGGPGGRGIRIKAPTLVVTFAPGKADLGALAPAADVRNIAPAGKPTAIMPTPQELKGYMNRFAFKQPKDMPEWQWRRVKDLFSLTADEGGFPESTDAYNAWVDYTLSLSYRMFRGHHTPLSTHMYLLYQEGMPEVMREHLRNYWAAWLMPGRPYTELQHNQWGIWTKPENSYYATTGDWRGNHSFYRDSYTRFMSTMNFNNNATQAALLGGAMINDPYAMADGRFGLEHILLRLWSWDDGTTQESIDHYYLGLTLYAQKAFADLGPTELDRMMGRNMLLKTMDELASCYHPAFRRFVSTSGRTGVAEMLGINEGVNAILHTVSKKGALHDVYNPDRLSMPAAGHDLPPDLVARQQLIGPWMPLWMGNIVDDKPLPFEMTADFRQWGAHRVSPLWKRSYLGHHYGLATLDVAVGNQTVPVMAQWAREPGQADTLQEIGTLLMRYGLNTTEFYDSLYHGTTQSNANGSVGEQGGSTYALQWKNKAIVFTSPKKNFADYNRQMPNPITSLQSSIALANYQPNPTWKIYVSGKPWDGTLPLRAKMSDRITIQDGLSYIGLIPIPATNLGRAEEILITDGGKPVDLQGGGKAAPTLVINSYNYCDATKPFDPKTVDWTKVDRAYGGFVIEMGDAEDYGSFAAFQQHVKAAKLELKWDDAKGVLNTVYKSGADTLEVGFKPEYASGWSTNMPSTECFPYRRVNGQWPYLAPGVDRVSNLSIQGTAGTLAKNGATLQHQPGLMAYLLTEPVSGNYLFSNPLPDPQYLEAAANGVKIGADGRLGLAQLVLNQKDNTLDVRYAVKEGQTGADMATALVVTGCTVAPKLTINGKAVKGIETTLNGVAAVVAPLAGAKIGDTFAARYAAAQTAQAAAFQTAVTAQARLRYKVGQEHYQLTEPRSGAFEFWRQWPNPGPIEATVPGNVVVATDGDIALQRLLVSPQEHRVEIDYAPYLQRDPAGNPIPNRAKALLVFGMDAAPTALLHGKEYAAPATPVTVNGKPAYLIPLFGDDPAALKDGLEKRYADAMGALPK